MHIKVSLLSSPSAGQLLQAFLVGAPEAVSGSPPAPLALEVTGTGPLVVRCFRTADGQELESVGVAYADGDLALVDAAGCEHLWVSVRGLSACAPLRRSSELTERLQAAYAKAGVNPTHRFVEARGFGQGSIWSYLEGARALAKRPPAHARAYVERLRAAAAFLSPAPGLDGALARLGDTLTLPVHALRYAPDTTPRGEATDAWAAVRTFPDPTRARFDCEDGAYAAIELFHLLRALAPARGGGPEWGQGYRAWLAICQIHEGTDYAAHCLALLLDERGERPPVVLESNLWIDGGWEHREPTEAEDAAYEEALSLAKKVRRAAGGRDKAVPRAPVSVARRPLQDDSRGTYGRLFSLFRADDEGLCARIFPHEPTLKEVLDAYGRADPREHSLRLSPREAAPHLARELALALPPRLPLPSAAPLPLPAPGHTPAVLARVAQTGAQKLELGVGEVVYVL